ncbi:NADP-dependent oxidoreductase domain-containing protein [Aspergillus karnatakaensis]|uniref:aldo/keto reductase n=1 Tax=Aspergillus karnatakaensis TaxID=1810916 RepID=UPI003CCE318F
MTPKRRICTRTFGLNNGTHIPAVGLGTWQGFGNATETEKIRDSIIHALHSGYRLIDTAQAYSVEPIVGEAVRSSGVPREEITVITKFIGCDPVAALQNSLDALGLDYVDIFLMHWPCTLSPDGKRGQGIDKPPTFVDTWRLMEGCVGERCRMIGVSNFTQKTLDALLRETTTIPVVNQVELHALNPNLKLVPYCQERGIQVISWSTMGGGAEFTPRAREILTNPLFQQIAARHECSTGVVSLSWAVQRGVIVIPKSSSPNRIEENIRLVTLNKHEMEGINNAHRIIGRLRIADHIQGMQRGPDGKSTFLGWTLQDFGWEDAEGNWLT